MGNCERVGLGIVSWFLVKGEGGGSVLVGAEIWESVLERGGSGHVSICVVLDGGRLGSPKR